MALSKGKQTAYEERKRGFAREAAAYESMRLSLEKDYPEKWVVVFDAKLAGVYDSEDEACADGARRFGAKEFLCRQVGVPVRTYVIPTLVTHGLLDADG